MLLPDSTAATRVAVAHAVASAPVQLALLAALVCTVGAVTFRFAVLPRCAFGRSTEDAAPSANARVATFGLIAASLGGVALLLRIVEQLGELADPEDVRGAGALAGIEFETLRAGISEQVSLYAARVALALAAPAAEIVVAHVGAAGPERAQDGTIAALERACAVLRHAAPRDRADARPTITPLRLAGTPGAALVRCVREREVDLVATATHGYGVANRLLLGSGATGRPGS